jgi:hypothetical protein
VAVVAGAGNHDLRRGRGREIRVEDPDRENCQAPAEQLREHEPGTEAGAMPANVSESVRPIVIAGLAKLVELVNQ